MFHLRDYQIDAIHRMHNGCILCGGVGSGKSRTALSYWYMSICAGEIGMDDNITLMRAPINLVIITTARKRDKLEWEDELTEFYMVPERRDGQTYIFDGYTITIDSWNNIKKYVNIQGSFFIFDEQRVVGKGSWVKSFLKIVKSNQWILLSATPGDQWSDYIPVFIANGFYRNRTDFNRQHCVFSPYTRYPVIEKYINTNRLNRLRRCVLVEMNYKHEITPHHEWIFVDNYDILKYKQVQKDRWNIFLDKPIENATEMCYILRKIVNTCDGRLRALEGLLRDHERVIIFYNLDAELEALRTFLDASRVIFAEWNGHKHEDIPRTNKWAYLVQYNSASEGWNCTLTDTIIFFSQNYSYKTMVQAAGRIDRLNTPFKDLWYYHLSSHSSIDLAINRALDKKKKFNENKFVGGF